MCRPLASAAKIIEQGNRIVFDPLPEKSYIENVETGEKMLLKRRKGVFVLDVGSKMATQARS